MAGGAVDPIGGYCFQVLPLEDEDSIRAHFNDAKDLWACFHFQPWDDVRGVAFGVDKVSHLEASDLG
jgi:hypothetical protein